MNKLESLKKEDGYDEAIDSGDFQLSFTENNPINYKYNGTGNFAVNNLKESELALEQNQNFCYHHNQELLLYCDSCEEPVCDHCTYLGPHNTQLHRINSIDEAYNGRVAKLSHLINANLIKKRDELMNQIAVVDDKIEGMKGKKEVVERDIRTECGYILERLKNSESSKLAIVTHEQSQIQNELESIESVNQNFEALTKDDTNIADFLLKSSMINKNIEHILSKPFKKEVDVNPWDLPHEIREIRESQDHYKVLEESMKFKNSVIWNLWKEKVKAEQAAIKELDDIATVDVKEWAELGKQYEDEQKKYHMICHFCGEIMDLKNINENCQINVHRHIDQDFEGYADEIPRKQFYGNSRHYFGSAKKDLFIKGDIIGDIKAMDIKDMKFNPLKKAFRQHCKKTVNTIQRIVQQKDINQLKSCGDLDREKSGIFLILQNLYKESSMLSNSVMC